MKTFFKKLEVVESTRIENAKFPYKTAQSETNFKANRMGSFSLRTSHKNLI